MAEVDEMKQHPIGNDRKLFDLDLLASSSLSWLQAYQALNFRMLSVVGGG